MNKFKVNDQVSLIHDIDYLKKGMIGRILFQIDGIIYTVKFDNWYKGHGTNHSCYNIAEGSLLWIPQSKKSIHLMDTFF